jgi:hypothetical protein
VTTIKQDCACRCGASRFTVNGDSIGRFYCHCTICQKVYAKPFADATYFWAEAIALAANQPIEFRRYRPPPALRRGICTKCGAPAVAFMRPVPGLAVAFVPTQNFHRPAELPAPDCHIFYDRRVADVADALPKVNGYWASEVHITRIVFASLLGWRRAA